MSSSIKVGNSGKQRNRGDFGAEFFTKKDDKTNNAMYEEISSWTVSFCLQQLTVAAKGWVI